MAQKERACYLSEDQISLLTEEGVLTTCEPKENLERIQPGITAEALASVGMIATIYDERGRMRGEAKIAKVLETTYGNPNLILVSGMGLGSDVAAFKNEYQSFWNQYFSHLTLKPDTVLVTTVYEWLFH